MKWNPLIYSRHTTSQRFIGSGSRISRPRKSITMTEFRNEISAEGSFRLSMTRKTNKMSRFQSILSTGEEKERRKIVAVRKSIEVDHHTHERNFGPPGRDLRRSMKEKNTAGKCKASYGCSKIFQAQSISTWDKQVANRVSPIISAILHTRWPIERCVRENDNLFFQ
mmetsp:Transcript_5845/g.11546  ORF Transcript_5845/g.11546 Transcript_5845/m.11546 type:complete len:167 (+) Transcript_5845:1067-1567(+)